MTIIANNTPDAIPEDYLFLLEFSKEGYLYKRPYSSNTIQVSFMTEFPVYNEKLYEEYVAKTLQSGDVTKSEFKQFSKDQQDDIKKIFSNIEKIIDVNFVYSTSPEQGAIRLGIADTISQAQ